jgi:hypothetical protein
MRFGCLALFFYHFLILLSVFFLTLVFVGSSYVRCIGGTVDTGDCGP